LIDLLAPLFSGSCNLTSKINPLFGIILSLSSGIEEKRKRRPSNVDESSFLVAGTGEISNFDLVRDLMVVVEYLQYCKVQKYH